MQPKNHFQRLRRLLAGVCLAAAQPFVSCVTTPEAPIPTDTRISPIPSASPIITTMPTQALAVTLAPATADPCAGLTREECANNGKHTYVISANEVFNGCESTVPVGKSTVVTHTFTTGSLTFDSGAGAARQSPNVYFFPETRGQSGNIISDRIIFTMDGYVSDLYFDNQPCVRITYTRTDK